MRHLVRETYKEGIVVVFFAASI